MPLDGFVKIEGIEGECSDDKHPGWIEIICYYNSLDNNIVNTQSSAGRACALRTEFGPFAFTKPIDKASPRIALACATGTHIETIIVELCRASSDKMTYMQYKLTNCIITSVRTSVTYGELFPSEDIEISFGRMEWCYTLHNSSGDGPAGNILGGWDQEKNAPV
jgi:type VI secretion system secreted protein Hcp